MHYPRSQLGFLVTSCHFNYLKVCANKPYHGRSDAVMGATVVVAQMSNSVVPLGCEGFPFTSMYNVDDEWIFVKPI
jgi:hypothetical protein